MRNAPAGTSFLQSLAEKDHRDRLHHHSPHRRHHDFLHHRQVDISLQIDATVASVTSTVSVIQDVEIDSNGSTVQIQTWLAASTTVEAPPDPTVPAATIVDTTPSASSTVLAAAPSTTMALFPLNTDIVSQSTSSQSLPPAPTSQVLTVTSTPFLGTNSSTSAGSLLGSSGSTGSTDLTSTSSSSLSSLSSHPLNSTSLTSVISESSTESTTSYSVSSELSTSLPSDQTSTESYGSSTFPTSTVAGGAGFGGGPGATSSSSSTSTTTAGSDGGTSDSTTSPSTPAVVGGVVGGIAGIVFIVALLMVLVRWRKRKQSVMRLGDSPSAEPPAIGGGTSGPSQSRAMTERSLPFGLPTTLANLAGYKRTSHQPSVDASSTAGSERGFYRVSGRKLPSVLQHGGDGYGGGYEVGREAPRETGHEAGHESLSGSSFYRDSRGFYGGPGSPSSPLAGRESGIPITRPSPARTPIISEGAFGPPSPSPVPPLDPPRRPDALGRSHPSRDGSHGSRFTEEV